MKLIILQEVWLSWQGTRDLGGGETATPATEHVPSEYQRMDHQSTILRTHVSQKYTVQGKEIKIPKSNS
jgi:hypothetical protein